MENSKHRTSEPRGIAAVAHIFSWMSFLVSFSVCMFRTVGEIFSVEGMWSDGKPSRGHCPRFLVCSPPILLMQLRVHFQISSPATVMRDQVPGRVINLEGF